MLTLLTYRVKPFTEQGMSWPEMQTDPAEWLRQSINMLMNRRKESLHKGDVVTDLFHNHDEKSCKTKSRYPLIIYHYMNSCFYVTGINQGAEALRYMISQYDRNIVLNKDMILTFEKKSEETIDVLNSQQLFTYKLTDWLPFNSFTYSDFLHAETLSDKILHLETTLLKQITDDMIKHFDIPLSGTILKILDIDSFNRPKIKHIVDKKYKHVFQPFTIVFKTNLMLPAMIAFGNCKSLGNGRLSNI